MGFKAEDAVPALDWDFTKYAGEDARGTSPEPSNQEIVRFISDWNNLIQSVRRTAIAKIESKKNKVEAAPAEELEAEIEKWSGMDWRAAVTVLEQEVDTDLQQEGEKLAQRMAELVETLTKRCPTAEQVMLLPGRIRAAYFGWIVGQVTDPESSSVVSSSSRIQLNGASSGI